MEIYVAASKAEPKSRVFSANGVRAEIEKEIIEAIKKQLDYDWGDRNDRYMGLVIIQSKEISIIWANFRIYY